MKKRGMTAVAVALVATVLLAGLASAAGPFAATDDRPGDGTATADDRYNPWLDDERAAEMGDRLGLTDAQVEQVQAEVRGMVDDGASREAVQARVTELLEEFGVDHVGDGPMAGAGPADGDRAGHGPGDGTGDRPAPGDGTGYGPGDGTGAGAGNGHGPGDGSCQG